MADRRRRGAAQALSSGARLSGKRVLITGASSGIGAIAAGMFAAEGARVAVLARGAEALECVRAEHSLEGPALVADVTDRAEVELAVEAAADALGGLDVLVSNAAAAVFGHFLEVDPDDFDRTVAATFTGAVNVVRAGLPHLRASRGTIVATGSLVSRVPTPGWSAYNASKHALRGFLNTVAIEEREQRTGVRVAIVHPGIIDTTFFARASNATGWKPRVPPIAYAPQVVAEALVAAAARPRREVLLGSSTVGATAGFALARPLAERVLVVADRWFRSGSEKAPADGSLRAPADAPRERGGIAARESVVSRAQLGGGPPPVRRAGKGLLRQGGSLLAGAARLGRTLVRPTSERRHQK